MLKWILLSIILCLAMGIYPTYAAGKDLLSQVWAYNGKSYSGLQSPEYISYDQVLRNYLAQRILRRFAVRLDPRKYSGFDLLEIEALFKFKRSSEPYDLFLKGFPKYR